jgi:hypothetical protein
MESSSFSKRKPSKKGKTLSTTGEEALEEKYFPSLGLNVKNKEKKLLKKFHNPFKVHKKDELLYMTREEERRNENFSKMKRENLAIWEKGSTFPSRAGIIKAINSIPAAPDKPKAVSGIVQTVGKSAVPTIERLRMEEKVTELKSIEEEEQQSELPLVREDYTPLDLQTPQEQPQDTVAVQQKPLIYLQQTEKRESVRDYLDNIRHILLAEMSINDKKEETQRIRELIKLKEDKLNLAKKQFESDVKRFTNYLDTIKRNAEEQTEKTERTFERSAQYQSQISNINGEISTIKNVIEKKIETLKIKKVY